MNKLNNDDLILLVDSEVDTTGLVGHHINSYNVFINKGIKQIITQLFRIDFTMANERDKTEEDRLIETIEFTGVFTDARVGRPTTDHFDTGEAIDLMPNHARKNRLNYSGPLYLDIEITAKAYRKDGGEPFINTDTIKNFKVSDIPIMVGSERCHTNNMTSAMRSIIEEDPNDHGGYFIIKGGEWAVSSSEARIFNKPNVFRNIGHEKEISRLEFISKPGDAFENSSQLIIRYVKSGALYISITTDYLNMDIPFYVIFRLMGMNSDKEICDNIIYVENTENDVVANHMFDILHYAMTMKDPNFGDIHKVLDRDTLLDIFIKQSSIQQNITTGNDEERGRLYLTQNIMKILDRWLLPHIGSSIESRHNKLRFLGHLIHKLLLVEYQIVESTDRDSLSNKRVFATGMGMSKAFKQSFNLSVVIPVISKMQKNFKTMPFTQVPLANNFKQAIDSTSLERSLIQVIITGDKEVKVGSHTTKNRLASERIHRKNQLNFLTTMRTVRTTTSTVSTKQDRRAEEMRRAHPSYLGFIDTIQSAVTGTQVGMVKQMTMIASISEASSSETLKEVLLQDPTLIPLKNVFPYDIYNLTKILVNGDWIGCTKNAPLFWYRYRDARRGIIWHSWQDKVKKENPSIDPLTSIYWDTDSDEINFWVDAGRMLRPVIVIRNNGELDPYGREKHSGQWKQWHEITRNQITKILKNEMTIKDLHREGLVDYITPDEMENVLIATDLEKLQEHENDPTMPFTYLDLAAGLVGIATLTCPYAEFNQTPKIVFQTNQGKQTNGIYALNWAHRYDKHGILQYYNEQPVIRTLANKYVYPIGQNAIVAIQCYGGYNMEDSLNYNKASAERGFVKCIHYGFIATELEKDEQFGNPSEANTADIKQHANYEKIVNGFPKPGTQLEHQDVVIGKSIELQHPKQNMMYKDSSIMYTEKEPATVESIVRARNNEDVEFACVKYSNPRELNIGSKFCLPGSTLVLTKTGWIEIKKIVDEKLNVEVAYYDNGIMRYTDEFKTVKYNCKNTVLYHREDDDHDIQCTLEHRFPTVNNESGEIEFYHALDIVGKNITGITTWTITNHDLEHVNCNGIIMNVNSWIHLITTFITGCVQWTSSFVSIEIEKDDIRINNPHVLYTKQEDKYIVKFYGPLCKYFKSMSRAFNGCTKLPEELWELSDSQLRLFSILFMRKLNAKKFSRINSDKLIEIQRLLLQVGIRIVVQNGYIIKRSKFQVREKITRTNDPVYCLRVLSGIFMIKRKENTIPMWTGNSSRHGQKGMTGLGFRQSDMMYTNEGLIPDLVLNPHAIPTRMTIGQLIEGNAAHLAVLRGMIGDATIYRNIDLDKLGDELEKRGMNRYSNQRMFNGTTGEWIDVMIFCTPVYYQRLQKFAVEEIYSITTGPTSIITRQPLEGKANKGGLRIGEMEKDVIISHGASHFIMEKFRYDSDGFYIYVCRNCGNRPVVNQKNNILRCNTCEDMGLEPQVFKVYSTWSSRLFFDELESMNVAVKLNLEPFAYE